MSFKLSQKGPFLENPLQQHLHKGKINVKPLKEFVFAKYPKDSAIYDVIVTEQDFLDKSEFLAKVGVWLKLSRRIKS